MNNSPKADARAHKLALKLRENLKKRKAQIKARQDGKVTDEQPPRAIEDIEGGDSQKK